MIEARADSTSKGDETDENCFPVVELKIYNLRVRVEVGSEFYLQKM